MTGRAQGVVALGVVLLGAAIVGLPMQRGGAPPPSGAATSVEREAGGARPADVPAIGAERSAPLQIADRLPLAVPLTIRGVVRDYAVWTADRGLRPLAGVDVRALGLDRAPLARARTAEDGSYALDLPGLDAVREFVATRSGYRDRTILPHAIEGADVLDLWLEPGRTVRGRVVDADGAPVEGAAVVDAGPPTAAVVEVGGRRSGLTDADGRFTAAFDDPGPHRLVFASTRHGLAMVDVPAEGPIGDVVLAPQGVIEGRLVARNGAPIRAARGAKVEPAVGAAPRGAGVVRIVGGATEPPSAADVPTAADGSLRVAVLRLGAYRLRIADDCGRVHEWLASTGAGAESWIVPLCVVELRLETAGIESVQVDPFAARGREPGIRAALAVPREDRATFVLTAGEVYEVRGYGAWIEPRRTGFERRALRIVRRFRVPDGGAALEIVVERL